MALELNKIYNVDVLDGLKNLDDESIDLIITSPPYNKAGFNGVNRKHNNDIWNKTIDYNDNVLVDCLPEEEYQRWQIEILNECYRVLKKDGSMFYNHKLRVKNNEASFPLEWINKSKFIFRQLITWDKRSSPNLDKCRYLPVSEYLFWLIKQKKNPRFKNVNNITDVWAIPSDKKNNHPAPFPIGLPDMIIPSVVNASEEKITVLDPFMGSGTVAMSALKHDCNYIGFEKFEKYYNSCNEAIEAFKKSLQD